MLTSQHLAWKREGNDWVLRTGKRKFGRIVPDLVCPGMWRPVLLNGRLGGVANMYWCKSVTLDAAVRELEWEIAQRPARAPCFPAQNEGVFEVASPPIAPIGETAIPVTPEAVD